MQAGLGHHADRLAELHHDCLIGLIDGEHGAETDDEHHQRQQGNNAACEIESHRLPPAAGAADCDELGGEAAGRLPCGRDSSLSGR